MNRFNYRIAIQLDRARDNDADFDDPIEIAMDEQRFALTESTPSVADLRATAIVDEIRAAIDAILAKHDAERRS